MDAYPTSTSVRINSGNRNGYLGSWHRSAYPHRLVHVLRHYLIYNGYPVKFQKSHQNASKWNANFSGAWKWCLWKIIPKKSSCLWTCGCLFRFSDWTVLNVGTWKIRDKLVTGSMQLPFFWMTSLKLKIRQSWPPALWSWTAIQGKLWNSSWCIIWTTSETVSWPSWEWPGSWPWSCHWVVSCRSKQIYVCHEYLNKWKLKFGF